MKKINFRIFIPIVIIGFIFSGCKKSFIEIQPEGVFLSQNYYKNEDQCFAALVATYDGMRKNSGGFDNMITFMNAGSDDNYAGGGGESDGVGIQSFSNYTLTARKMPASFWGDHYQGIYKANVLLDRIDGAIMDATVKARFIAEAKALRALYYFNLVRMFKNIPLLTKPLVANDILTVTQAAPTAVYAQIEKDLLDAIAVLPATVSLPTEAGRFNKGAAQALLGKVYLFENKKPEAAAQFAIVNGTPGGVGAYGNKLLANFSDLWLHSNKFNTEGIIETCHSAAGNTEWGFWGTSADEGNTVNQMVGPRTYSRTAGSTAPNLPSGWSFNVFTQDFYDAIKLDPRFAATVLDAKSLQTAGQINYVPGYQNTGYFLNKFIPRAGDVRSGGGQQELNYRQNSYVIRLADCYLMEAEALGAVGARAQALLDAVRARVGLPSVPVSLAAIKQERRLELAGEGHRFFDLVRWGDAAAKLGNRGPNGTAGFVVGKSEIFPIPFDETQGGTLIVQNPNYQ